MVFDPRWYTESLREQSTPVAELSKFENMDESALRKIVDGAAVSNGQRQAEALRKADSYSFQVAHPELKRTARNMKIINHWLTTKGIDQPSFADIAAAYDATQSVLDIDKDQPTPTTFKGAFTKQTFNSLDELIAQERRAALQQVTPSSAEQIAFENLPNEQALPLIRQAERVAQRKANAPQVQYNSDAWMTLHPEYVDDDHNANLMTMQLRANGCDERTASIEDCEIAYRQLRASGLLKLDAQTVREQHTKELKQSAKQALNTPGTLFDKTSEEEMYSLPLDELKRRANGNYSGAGV
jgi:hypothetical protein